jgi:hypothetical protein
VNLGKKILCHLLPMILFVIMCDWFFGYTHLYTVGIRTNSPPFTFLHYILSSVLRVVYII